MFFVVMVDDGVVAFCVLIEQALDVLQIACLTQPIVPKHICTDDNSNSTRCTQVCNHRLPNITYTSAKNQPGRLRDSLYAN